MLLMDKINSTEKALKYLAMNQKGKISELNRIDEGLTSKLIESGMLTLSKEEYTFSQEGVDIYYNGYRDNKELNFFGI